MFTRLDAGAGAVLWFEGAPGIGKTALLDAVGVRAGSGPTVRCRAAGHELEAGFSFGVALQLLESVVRGLDPEAREAVLSGAAALARPLLLPDDDLPDDDALDRTIHGLFWVVANLAERAPLVLVVDDLQWVDAASLRFLNYLAGRIDDLPVAIVGAVRSDAAAGDDVLRTLLGRRLAERRLVGPLSVDAVTELAGESGGPRLRGLLHQLTGGNPLLVHELLENLQVVHERPEDASAAVLPTVLNRLGRLPDDARRLAEACAVLDDGASLALALELAGLNAPVAADARDQLIATAVLVDADVVRFVHPLVRSTVVSTIDRVRYAALHGTAANLLDERGAPVDVVAAHLVECDAAGSSRAVEVLRLAARRALRSGMAARSVSWLRRAIAEGSGEVDRPSLLFDLAAAEAAAGDGAWRAHVEDALAMRPEPVVAAGALLRVGNRLQAAGAMAEAAATAWRGFELVPEGERELRLRLLGAYAGSALIDLSGRDEALTRISAATADNLLDDDDASRGVLVHLAYDSAIRGGTVGQADAAEVAALATQALAGSPRNPVPAILALTWCDELDGAERALTAYAVETERRADLVGRSVVAGYRSSVHLQRCCPQAAAADAEISREGYALGWRVAAPGAAGNLALARLELDDVDGAEAALELPESPHAWEAGASFSFWLYARGQVLLAQRRWDSALAVLLESGRRQDAMGSTNPNVFPWRGAAALACARLGEQEQAAALIGAELELARRFGAPRAIASALRVAAALGPSETRVEGLQEAAVVAARSPSIVEQVRVDLDLGAALRLGGNRVLARQPLLRALDVAERSGALAMARRAREELSATGAKPRRAALTGPAALTPSERRVAERAADGRRNREIAEELFVSVKAVEYHLGNAYRKLGVSTRDDLSAALTR